MRTITIRDLNDHISLVLDRLMTCLEHPAYCPWPDIASMSLEHAKKQLVNARRRARRNIERDGDTYPGLASEWIAYVLAAETCRFVVWLRCSGCVVDVQQRDEIDLLLVSTLGAEIKRLGFQLAL